MGTFLRHSVHLGEGAFAPITEWPGAKFTLRPSLVLSYIGIVIARHSSSGRPPNFAAWYLHATGQPTLGGRTVYTVSQKMSHLWLAITLMHVIGF